MGYAAVEAGRLEAGRRRDGGEGAGLAAGKLEGGRHRDGGGGAVVIVRETGPVYGTRDAALVVRETGPVYGTRGAALVVRETGPAYGTRSDPDRRAHVDPDRLEDLADEIVTLAAHIHAAEYRLLTLIAEFDRLRGWEPGGHKTCAHWLHARTGTDLGAARERVRAARALGRLPGTSAAMARGELSFSQVRALTRVAAPENERDLLELARGCTTAQLERMVRAWKKGTRQDEADRERELRGSRCLSVFPDDEGMYVVRGRLTPEVGALLMRALEAASDALFKEQWVPGTRSEDTEREAAQRRADAVGLLAERAFAAGFGRRVDGDPCECGEACPGGDACPCEGVCAEGCGCGCESETAEAPISGTRAERYMVVVRVDQATLSSDGEPGVSELEDGTRVSAETSRRLACDCSLVKMTVGRDGSVLDVGRKSRSTPPALRRALEARDRGCRFPGCGSRFTQAHHVVHWVDGGATKLTNTLLLCDYHHKLPHEGGWKVVWWGEGRPVFIDPRGGEHFDGGWTPPRLPERPVAAMLAANRDAGVDPNAHTLGGRWKSEKDIPAEVLFRATEAVL